MTYTELLEMRDNIKYCYKCQRMISCARCEYNKNKLPVLDFVSKELVKRSNLMTSDKKK